MTPERRYDIDWLRVIAIGLLLIYHIAIVFQPWAMFVGFIKSTTALETLWKPMTLLNVWRIPLLFFVSGMGVYFAMKKRNWRQLLLERSKRILLPFVFGIIAICPLHFMIFQEYYQLPWSYYPHMGHLWFLGNIFVYVLVLAPVFYYLKNKASDSVRNKFAKLMSYAIGPLLISLFFMLETVIVDPPLFEVYAETWHGFFIGLLAFFFGFLFVYCGDSFWKTVAKWKWLYLGIAILLYSFRMVEFEATAANYFKAFESNCWIFALFGIGYSYLNKPSALLVYLSQAAYPVYIIHMFVLFAGSLIILPLPMSASWQFLLISVFTFIGCFLIYEFLIRRVRLLRPLFGLKNKKISIAKDKSVYTEPIVIKEIP